MRFYLGCAVWAFPGWVGSFFPPGTRQPDMLRLYGERMWTVEGNAVFYAVPPAETLARWVEMTPPGFRFCPKIPRVISHEGALAPKIPEALSFLRYMRDGLGQRLGPVFLQLPPGYGPERGPDLARLLNAWRREADHPLLVEVRHPGWFTPEYEDRLDTLLRRLGMGRVLLDTRPIYAGEDDPQAESQRRKPELPLHPVATGPVVFVRFISHPDPARNTAELEAWAAQVHAWLDEKRTVFFFVHCPFEEFSPACARRFQALLEARGAPVPPLPWTQLPPPPQVALF
ncbi:MAG: DUF72 domain-containing protein [Alphaproteobacteria bacterium]|nr:DUF72 domain-containing protein [Alphaproteobacteria bacterium]